MRVGRKGLVAVVILAVAGTVHADDAWLSVGPSGFAFESSSAVEVPAVGVNRSEDRGLALTVGVSGVVLSDRSTKGGAMIDVGWPDAAMTGAIGTPALPVVRRLFLAPPESIVTVTAAAGGGTVVDLGAAGFAAPLMPVQAPVAKLPGALERAPFDYNADAYGRDEVVPAGRAKVVELGIVRGQRLFLLEVSPVAYNPVSNRLTVWSGIEVSIAFRGGKAWPVDRSAAPGLDRVVLNPEPLRSSPRASGNYLIIADGAFESAIQGFADAKDGQGFTVSVWVPSTSSTTAIKDYIESLWDTPDAPDYILLVGDTDTIPHWTGGGAGSPATDLPYSCMDGASDWYPDIALGRFPARTTGQLEAIVDKTLLFEDGEWADHEYDMRAVFMASEDNWTVSEGTHNWVIEHYMDPMEIVSDKLYCHTYSATTQQVRDAFNDGRFYGIYSGHGGTYSWADGPPFSQSDVRNLTNEGMYAFVCSFACITGTYTVDECFVETWIREPNKGAAAIYGSSVNSYWTEDDVLEKRLFDAIYDAEDDVPAEVAPVWNDARMRYLAQMGTGSTTRRYFEMYNLMGDPSLSFPNAGEPLEISMPYALPVYLTPGVPTPVTILVEEGTEALVPDSPTLYFRDDGGEFAGLPMAPLGEGMYEVDLPACACGAVPEYYFSATGDAESVVFSPADAPDELYSAEVANVATILDDDFESELGWSTEHVDLQDGAWQRGVPAGDGTRGDPVRDADGSGSCYVTANRAGNSDVDGGPTRLLSPMLDLRGLVDPDLRYSRWYTNDDQDEDCLDVEISDDAGASWTLVERVTSSVYERPEWVDVSVKIADYVQLTSQVQVRFSVADNPNNSVTEAGVDGVVVVDITCRELGRGDFDGDGDADLDDYKSWDGCMTGPGLGPIGDPACGAFDFDGDRDVDLEDFERFQSAFGG